MEKKVEKPISELMGVTMEKIKEMIDVSSVIGAPIKIDDDTTIIPISKVSYGFASGGSDLPNKMSANLFGGGAGAGASIKAEGFLYIYKGDAKMIPITGSSDPVSVAISAIPGIVEKLTSFFNKDKNTDENSDELSDEEIEDMLG